MAAREDNTSFPTKHSKKAVTPSPSITSSTTGNRPRKKVSGPSIPLAEPLEADSPSVRLFETNKDAPEAELLTPEEQEQVWSWLVKGASPQVACQQLGLSLPAFWRTLEGDVAFATALQQLFDTLSHNVLAALYRAAMEGNVTAQQFWLRHRPARAWQAPAVSELTDDPADFADAELLERAFAEGADIPPEVASCLSATGRPEESRDLPSAGPSDPRSDRQ